jgi:L-threonylcarbamoyladenylate synthase
MAGPLVTTDLALLVDVLERGGVVACATETLMGLLADALNPEAVERVVELKGRAADNPMAVLLPGAEAWDRVAREIPPVAREWARTYWPGPLTMVTWAREGLPSPLVRDGKVGARVPGPSPALELVRAFGGPLTATSANRAGEPALSDLEGVLGVFGAALDAACAGSSPGGDPSTVVDVTQSPPQVLRAGARIPPIE